MIIWPPLLKRSDINGECERFVELGTTSVIDENDCFVRCPLVSNALIKEGACYDFQAYSHGTGPKKWLELTAQEYERHFGVDRKTMAERCLKHQIEILTEDGDEQKQLPTIKKMLADRL